MPGPWGWFLNFQPHLSLFQAEMERMQDRGSQNQDPSPALTTNYLCNLKQETE